MIRSSSCHSSLRGSITSDRVSLVMSAGFALLVPIHHISGACSGPCADQRPFAATDQGTTDCADGSADGNVFGFTRTTTLRITVRDSSQHQKHEHHYSGQN